MRNMASAEKPDPSKFKLWRCIDWLQKQNLDSKKLSQQNKNDIQFIIQTNAARKKFLLSAAEDEATVPVGVDESNAEPKSVPIHRLRIDNLRIECEWQSCRWTFTDYEQFQKHVREHIPELHVIENDNKVEFVCLWDVCGHKTPDFSEMVRHINYHAYHAHLLAIGFNGRATLNLLRCKRDSSKRNQLPALPSDHCCMWTGCNGKFNAIQTLFDHVRHHVKYADTFLCSWAGCGMTFTRRSFLKIHMRSHTVERVIACYHCGCHFSCNRKLCDHLRRQNVHPNSSYSCSVCTVKCATEYLLREHTRQHVCAYACALCDMSAPTPGSLAQHMRYRHLATRPHACDLCDYRGVSIFDLRRHKLTHKRKKNRDKKDLDSDVDCSGSEEENSDTDTEKKPKVAKMYVCHMCPEKNTKVFSRGARLTTHLVNVHGVQWPFGHVRFRYQISNDGMYRLTTTRYEVLEVSKKIVDSYGQKDCLKTSFEFNLKQVADATEYTPRRFEISLKGDEEQPKPTKSDNAVEITMCDVDEDGNIISSEVITSDVVVHSLDGAK